MRRPQMPTALLTWWRSWRAGALVVLGAGVVAVVVGVTTATVQGSLGPHRATYAVVVNHLIEVDLGPLGALVLDSPLPWPLGVEVRVREIPAGLTAAGGSPESALAVDLDGYLQFFAQPELALREAGRGLLGDALARTVLAWSILLVLVAAVRLAALRGGVRIDLRRIRARSSVSALLAAGVLAVSVVGLRDGTNGHRLEGRLSPVLAGTPLADARIVGRLGDIVDTYGAYALDAIERNREFYDAARANLIAAYEADVEPLAPRPYAVRKSLEAGAHAADENDAAAMSAEAVSEPADVQAATAEPRTGGSDGRVQPGLDGVREDELVTLLVIADLHCNVGMARVVGEAARLTQADAVLNAGDTVISGTSVERFCVTALAEAVPSGVPVVVSDGNHDSTLTSEQELGAGHVVLVGDPVVVAGVRVLGDAEPIVTTVTEGVRLRGEESREALGLRLAERACEAEEAGQRVDILLLHNPRSGVTPMTSGCISLQISGHFHRTLGPTHQGLGVLYVTGSTAGATAGKTSIGPLQSPGVMTVMRYDPAEHRPVDHRIVTVGIDGSVHLGRWLPFPGPPVAPVAAELDLPDPLPVTATAEP